MSYLANLAQRAFGVAAVRPLLPAAFALAGRPIPADAGAGPAADALERAQSGERPAASRSAVVRPLAEAADSPARAAGASPAVLPSAAPAAPRTLVAPSRELREEALARRAAPAAELTPEPALIRQPSPHAPAVHLLSLPSVAAAAPAAISSRVLVSPRLSAAAASPRMREHARAAVSQAESPHAPTVHVRIGRIDVRAVQTPAAAAAPAVPRPGIKRASLEDYLRGGSGGKP